MGKTPLQMHTDKEVRDQSECRLSDIHCAVTSPDRMVYACYQNGQESLKTSSVYAYVPKNTTIDTYNA